MRREPLQPETAREHLRNALQLLDDAIAAQALDGNAGGAELAHALAAVRRRIQTTLEILEEVHLGAGEGVASLTAEVVRRRL